MITGDENPFAAPLVRMTRVRRFSMAVTLVVSGLCVIKLGQIFNGEATAAFNTQDQYRLRDAAEAFTLSVLFILPLIALSTYWLTRLIIAAPQIISRYMASCRRSAIQRSR